MNSPLQPIDTQMLTQAAADLHTAGHRGILLLTGSLDACRHWLINSLGQAARPAHPTAETAPPPWLWIGEAPLEGLLHSRADKALHWLGCDLGGLVWDTYCGLNPDALAALCGAIVGGGWLVLRVPPLPDWPHHPDPDYARLGLTRQSPRFFWQRLAQSVSAHPVRLLQVEETTPAVPLSQSLRVDIPLEKRLTPDQQAAIAAVKSCWRGRQRRPLLISADRGRGKSTAVGIALGQLMQEQLMQTQADAGVGARILLSGPRTSAVARCLEQAAQHWPEARKSAWQLSSPDGQRDIAFVPVDGLLSRKPDARLLVIDEAAAIPQPQLMALIRHWPRVLLISTLQGYEGSGQGFALRLNPWLNQHCPGWSRLHLQQPVRWQAGDPLEAWLNAALLMDAEAASPFSLQTAPQTAPQAAIVIEHWPREQRSQNEQRLRQVYGLLRQAHYRTTPADLRQLLDEDQVACWLAIRPPQGQSPQDQCPEAVLGVIWIKPEGELSSELAQAVALGQRRLRGHLIPQALAFYGASAETAQLRMARVVRIAVCAAVREQGIGRRLLAAARAAVQADGYDWLATAFGATPALLNFWSKAGLQLLRLGLQADARSGIRSAFMAQALSSRGELLAGSLQARFAQTWPGLLSSDLQQLPADTLLVLSRLLPLQQPLTAQDQLELAAFAQGHRPLAISRLALQRLSSQASFLQLLTRLDEALAARWCRLILQQHSSTGHHYAESQGKAADEADLRALVREWLTIAD